jgi:hypothetical protein
MKIHSNYIHEHLVFLSLSPRAGYVNNFEGCQLAEINVFESKNKLIIFHENLIFIFFPKKFRDKK